MKKVQAVSQTYKQHITWHQTNNCILSSLFTWFITTGTKLLLSCGLMGDAELKGCWLWSRVETLIHWTCLIYSEASLRINLLHHYTLLIDRSDSLRINSRQETKESHRIDSIKVGWKKNQQCLINLKYTVSFKRTHSDAPFHKRFKSQLWINDCP